MARAAKAAGTKKSGLPRPLGSPWLLGLLCGGMLAALPATGLLLGVLLAPAGIAIIADQSQTRPVARVVALMGMVIAAPALSLLWHGSNNIAAALDIAADLRLTATAWAAQGAGWLVAELAPVLVHAALAARAQARIISLQRRRAALEQEWGIPPH